MKISEKKRRELLKTIEDPATAVGIQIPDNITWNGEEIRLREEVWKITHRSGEETEERKRALISIIDDLLRERINSIRNDDITVEEGERLTEECVGLERAKENLLKEKREAKPVTEEIREKEIEDQKRWLDLVKRVK